MVLKVYHYYLTSQYHLLCSINNFHNTLCKLWNVMSHASVDDRGYTICQCGYVGEMSWSYFVIYFKSVLLKRQLSFTIYVNASLRLVFDKYPLKSGALTSHSSNLVIMTHVSYMWRDMLYLRPVTSHSWLWSQNCAYMYLCAGVCSGGWVCGNNLLTLDVHFNQ